jgi:hypothetical protein
MWETAFLLPMLVHIMDQPELEYGDGPIGLVLAPTRELCLQIHTEAKRLARAYSLHVRVHPSDWHTHTHTHTQTETHARMRQHDELHDPCSANVGVCFHSPFPLCVRVWDVRACVCLCVALFLYVCVCACCRWQRCMAAHPRWTNSRSCARAPPQRSLWPPPAASLISSR